MTTCIFKKNFLRDQNSQHFNEDLVAVNTFAFSFVLFFKVIDYTGASHYVIQVLRIIELPLRISDEVARELECFHRRQ